MHCLWGLQQQFTFELKGGASLSKGFKVIDRFSEDLDIRIEPPVGMDVKVKKNQDKAAHVDSRREYYKWLASKIAIPGIVSVERDTGFDNEKLMSAGIRLHYKSYFPVLHDTRDGVLLEVGFDVTTPNQEVDISSWAFEHAFERGVPITDNRAYGVKCYAPEYTFVEKLQAISTKFRRQQAEGAMPQNFLRHYYDIYQLLALPQVQKFIGSEDYKKKKQERFPTTIDDPENLAENEAFLLSDSETRALYAAEYEKTPSLYFKGQVPFEDILQRIKENIDRL